ncbi:MAG TPA: FAD:protein FMN transferase [Bacteroidota bacterium]|nr:FAD:protein FMN transferase [Bacteroidota bacterium]
MNIPRALLLIPLAASMPACSRRHAPVVRETSAMDTYVTISVFDQEIPEKAVNTLIDSAFGEIRRVEAFASDYIDSSEIGRANRRAGTDSLEISAELAALLRRSLAYSDSSGGAFDVTVGPLETLWNILGAHPRVPPADSIRDALRLVGYRLLRLHGRMLYLPRRGMHVDLGAIGKGYAADRAMDLIARGGVTKAIVDMGGNLAIRWPGAAGWENAVATISVRHPRIEGSFLGTFRYGTGGVSTSGDYERCFILDGVRYHHIMDPATGAPARGVVSVTIVAPNATDADAISTTVFVLGRHKGMAFMRRLPGVDGFIVYEQGDSLAIDYSPGFLGRLDRGSAHD